MDDLLFLKTSKMIQNFLIILILGVFLISCSEKRTSTIPPPINSVNTFLEDVPDKIIDKSKLFYDTKKSLWTLNDQVYSGYVVSFYPDSTTLKERFGILKGRKQNQAIHWYPDGHYKYIVNYHKGKQHGDKKSWSPDSLHILVSHFKYVYGKPHGEQKKWYPTGELFKTINLNMGKEEGIQQAFRKNGDLFANYEAREGRIFGLKRAALCFSLEDESVQYKN